MSTILKAFYPLFFLSWLVWLLLQHQFLIEAFTDGYTKSNRDLDKAKEKEKMNELLKNL